MNDNLVELIGGPFDGAMVSGMEQVAGHQLLEVPMSPAVLRCLSGETPGRRRRVESIAVYFPRHEHPYKYAFHRLRRVEPDEVKRVLDWQRETVRSLQARQGHGKPFG